MNKNIENTLHGFKDVTGLKLVRIISMHEIVKVKNRCDEYNIVTMQINQWYITSFK